MLENNYSEVLINFIPFYVRCYLFKCELLDLEPLNLLTESEMTELLELSNLTFYKAVESQETWDETKLRNLEFIFLVKELDQFHHAFKSLIEVFQKLEEVPMNLKLKVNDQLKISLDLELVQNKTKFLNELNSELNFLGTASCDFYTWILIHQTEFTTTSSIEKLRKIFNDFKNQDGPTFDEAVLLLGDNQNPKTFQNPEIDFVFSNLLNKINPIKRIFSNFVSGNWALVNKLPLKSTCLNSQLVKLVLPNSTLVKSDPNI